MFIVLQKTLTQAKERSKIRLFELHISTDLCPCAAVYPNFQPQPMDCISGSSDPSRELGRIRNDLISPRVLMVLD